MSTRKLFMVIRVSIESLTGHKLRSFLTMLGVVIGVGAVIALVAVGQGAQAQVVSQFASLGANMLTVQAGSDSQFSRGGLRQTVRALNTSDVDAIKGLATSVALVSPEYSANNATVTYQGKTTSTSVTGVTAEYAPVRNWAVSMGRFITAEDDSNMASVAILGQKTVETLFGSATANPIGETIRINRQSYEVIGVLTAKGQSGPTNQDAVVMIPLHTAQLKLGGAGTTSLRTIALQVRSAGEMDLAQAQVTAILRSLHGIQTGGNDDFTVRNQSDIVATVEATTSTFTTLLGSIAAISLLVGGIGIMNIMLVSVTERTRDRRAQGRGRQAR
jgi:putative ABC transport system permease protein